MTGQQYKRCLTVLGLSHVTAAAFLGVSWRQSYRWAAGTTPVPRPVELVLLTCIATDSFPEQLAATADSALKAMRPARAA